MSANPYDPVTTTDSTNLADDDWGLNLPNIRYKSYGPSRFKGFCNFLRDRARLLLILAVIFVIGIVLISIIVVATHSSPGRKPSSKDKEKRWQSPNMGLVFYPKPSDGSTIITFTLDSSADNPAIKSLNDVTEGYKIQKQFKSPYTDCTAVNNPANKICRLGNAHFGNRCTQHNGYGYPHAMPCILVQLNLPNDTIIQTIPEQSMLWPVSKMIMTHFNDSNYIPVTCEGSTTKDRLILGVKGFDKADYHPIQYFPPDGLSSLFYRQRNMSLPFLKPAMMIHLTSLKDNTMVHITCTAWGQLFDFNGKMIDHELLTTSFGVFLSRLVSK